MAIKGVEVWLLYGYRVNANICTLFPYCLRQYQPHDCHFCSESACSDMINLQRQKKDSSFCKAKPQYVAKINNSAVRSFVHLLVGCLPVAKQLQISP